MDIVDGSSRCVEMTQGDANKNISREQMGCLVSIFQLGLVCSAETPQERINIEQVLQGTDNSQRQVSKLIGIHC